MASPWRMRIVTSVAATALCIGMGTVGAGVLMPVLAVGLVARMLPRHLVPSHRLLYAACVTWTLMLVISIVGTPLIGGPNALVTFPVICAAAALATRRAGPNVFSSLAVRGEAALSLAPAILVFGMLFSAGVFIDDGGPRSVGQRLALVTSAEDGASHLAIHVATAERGVGLISSTRLEDRFWAYPPGFHVGSVHLERSLERTAGTAWYRGGRTDAFWIAGIVTIAFLAWSIGELAASIGRVRRGRHMARGALGVIVAVAVLLGPSIDLFTRCFYPQLLAIAWLLVGMLALRELADHTERRVASVLLTVLVAWTWHPLLPLALVASVILAWDRPSGRRRSTVVMLGAIALAAVPIGARFLDLDDRSQPLTASLTTSGGVASLSPGYVFVAALLAIAVASVHEPRANRATTLMIVAAGASVLAVQVFQLVVAGEVSYYYWKLLASMYVILTPVVLGLAASIAVRAPDAAPRVSAMAGAVAALVFVWPQMLHASTSTFAAYRGGDLARVPQDVLRQAIDVTHDENSPIPIPWNVIPVGHEDYLAARYTFALADATTIDAMNSFFVPLATRGYDPTIVTDYRGRIDRDIVMLSRDETIGAEVGAPVRIVSLDDRT